MSILYIILVGLLIYLTAVVASFLVMSIHNHLLPFKWINLPDKFEELDFNKSFRSPHKKDKKYKLYVWTKYGQYAAEDDEVAITYFRKHRSILIQTEKDSTLIQKGKNNSTYLSWYNSWVDLFISPIECFISVWVISKFEEMYPECRSQSL